MPCQVKARLAMCSLVMVGLTLFRLGMACVLSCEGLSCLLLVASLTLRCLVLASLTSSCLRMARLADFRLQMACV